jgi:signal transduction histidine kinase
LHASHELKTPLTVMHTELETALTKAGIGAEEKERLASQLDEVQRLSRIVDGLTLLTKAGAGQIQLAAEPVPLAELVSEAVHDAQTLGVSRQLEVSCEPCEPVTVIGDRHRLRQLLLNLTDNAVKYNRPGGTVKFSLSRTNNTAELRILNTGAGIERSELAKVFDPFYRGQNPGGTTTTTDGCGLGLSIAQWITRAHEGTIAIESNVDAVTTVTVRLPLKQEAKS